MNFPLTLNKGQNKFYFYFTDIDCIYNITPLPPSVVNEHLNT